MNKIGETHMKKSSALTIAIAVILSSCGTTAQYASSDKSPRFQDGIYSSAPSLRTSQEKTEAKAQTDELVRKTKESAIYLFGDKKDTVMIPENMYAKIQFDQKVGGTTVTVGENPYDWRYDLENNYGYYYGPYGIGSSWYWSGHYNPWYWNSWAYTPWRYHGWYDPFYISGWYDPWYYGFGGWYDPWYCGWPHYHHYCGWYGGWDPHWGHHHGPGYYPGGDRPEQGRDRWHGLRAGTGSGSIASGSNAIRGGGSSTTRIGTTRVESSSRPASITRRPGSDARSATRVSPGTSGVRAPQKNGLSGIANKPSDNGKKPGARYTGQSNYRKPSNATAPTRALTESRERINNDTHKAESRTQEERSYNRGSTYNRSSSFSRSSSSYSTPSYNRSSGNSGGSSGGFSRSGGGGGGRRR
jgi:hypothetical protein